MGNAEQEDDVTWYLEYIRECSDRCYGKIGDGREYDDCVYQMLQEVIKNSIDEFKTGYGNRIEISIDYASGEMSVRDYGRGAPIGNIVSCFVGGNLRGMWPSNEIVITPDCVASAGVKKVCALSVRFHVRSVREGEYGEIVVEGGKMILHEQGKCAAEEKNGLFVRWIPDATIFPKLAIVEEHVVRRIKECAAANPGLKFILNEQEITVTEKVKKSLLHDE